MELPKASFDELPSPTSDLAWSPSPSKQRLPALSPHLSLPSPHRRGSFDASPTRRRRDAALELELGAPDGQGGRVGERLSLGSDDSGSPVRRRKHRSPKRKKRHSRSPEHSPIKESVLEGITVRRKGFGGRRKIDKKSRRKHKGRKQYARLDEYAQQQEEAAAPGPAPSLVKSRPETPADIAPEESDGSSEDELEVEDDGIQGVPSLANPLYLRIKMADGVLARTGAEVARMAVYPINKHCIVRCIKRVTRQDNRSGKHIRWYLINAPVPGSGIDEFERIIPKEFSYLSDNEEGVWIRSMRNMIGFEEVSVVQECTRAEYAEKCRSEHAAFESIEEDAALALIEADVNGCAAFIARATRRLEERRVMIRMFAPICRELETSIEARKKATEVVLNDDGDEIAAMNATREVHAKARKEAIDKARLMDLRYRPEILLGALARSACETHNPREALWTLLLGVAARVNLFILQNNKTRLFQHEAQRLSTDSALRGDIFVGLAFRGEEGKLRDLLRRGYASADVCHSAAQISALFAAVSSGAVGAVAALLDHGAAVDTRDLHDDFLPYPLHVAAYNGYHRVTKLLLERGADRYPVNSENQTAHALCKKKWIQEGGDGLDRCCELLRLEPTVVEGVYVASTTDRSITIEWPVPPDHKVDKLEADQIVEAYKATAIESGVGSEERTLIRKRSECLKRGGVYQLTFHDLPSLVCLEVSVCARTNGLYGPLSDKVIAFTEGRRPRPCDVPHLAGVGLDWLRVEFESVEKTEDKSFEERAPPLEFECELCTWAHREAKPIEVGDVEWATDVDTDDDEEQHSPSRWSLQTVQSVFVEFDYRDEEPPLAEFVDVRQHVASFLLGRGFEEPLRMPALYARARARNKYGWGPFSVEARVGRPREPVVKAVDSTTTSVSLKWDALDRRSAAYEVIVRLSRPEVVERRKRVLFAFNTLPLLNQRRRYPPQPPQQELVIENRRGQRAWRDDDDIWTRVSRDRTACEVVATRLRPGRSYDVRIRSCPLLGPPDDWSNAACGVVKTAPVRPEAPPAPLPPTNADALLMVLAKGLGKNTQRRNLTSMRLGTDRRPSGDSDALGEMAARRRPRKATPDRRRSFESDSDDDAFGEPSRRDGLIADDRRLGACSDEGAYLGWCRVILPPSKDTNGSAVDKWEVEVKSDEVEVRHSCSTDEDKGVATVFLVPARSYDIRSRCRNSAGWSRWSLPLQIKTPCGLCPPPTMRIVNKSGRQLQLRVGKPCVIDVGKIFRAGGRGGKPIVTQYEENEPNSRFPSPAEPTGSYEITSRDIRDKDDAWQITPKKSSKATFKTVIKRLTPGETYDIRVRARYEAGWSAWSACLRVMTAPG